MYFLIDHYQAMTELSIMNNREVTKPNNFLDELLKELDEQNIGATQVASTIKSLLNAKTLNQQWKEMDDNSTRFKTIKFLAELNWIKTGWWININLLNMNVPDKNMPLKY